MNGKAGPYQDVMDTFEPEIADELQRSQQSLYAVLQARLLGVDELDLSYTDDAGIFHVSVVSIPQHHTADDDLELLHVYHLQGKWLQTARDRLEAMKRQATARRAALAKAERHQAAPPDTELEALYQRAHVALEAEGYARIGRRRLNHKTRQMVGREHPRRADITEHRAELYLQRRLSGLI